MTLMTYQTKGDDTDHVVQRSSRKNQERECWKSQYTTYFQFHLGMVPWGWGKTWLNWNKGRL